LVSGRQSNGGRGHVVLVSRCHSLLLLISGRLVIILLLISAAVVPVLLVPISPSIIIIVAPVVLFTFSPVALAELFVGTGKTTFPIHIVFVGFALARVCPKLAQVVHIGTHSLTPRTGSVAGCGRIVAGAFVQMRIWVTVGEHLAWVCRRIEIVQKTVAVGEIVDGRTIERCLQAFRFATAYILTGQLLSRPTVQQFARCFGKTILLG